MLALCAQRYGFRDSKYLPHIVEFHYRLITFDKCVLLSILILSSSTSHDPHVPTAVWICHVIVYHLTVACTDSIGCSNVNYQVSIHVYAPVFFYQPAACEAHGRLVLRLLCCFRVCIYICVSALITCAIITSLTLLPCDLTLVDFSN